MVLGDEELAKVWQTAPTQLLLGAGDHICYSLVQDTADANRKPIMPNFTQQGRHVNWLMDKQQ
jgi:hypothetical protein